MSRGFTLAVCAWLLAVPALGFCLEITQVRIDRESFRPDLGEIVTVRFVLSEPGSARLNIYDGRDYLVQTVPSSTSTAGEHAVVWDGQSMQGELVPPEAYRYTISATSEHGEDVIHDLTSASAGEDVPILDEKWLPDDGVIEYRLPEAARVNIRVGLKNFGPLMKTVIDWVPRAAGVHREPWNGLDESGVLDLSMHPSLQIVVDAFALGRNVVLVGPPPSSPNLIASLGEENSRDSSGGIHTGDKRMHFHSQQPMESRGDVLISLSLPDGLPVDEQGTVILSGRIPVRMEVDESDRQRVLDRRFEPVFFVDGTFAFENEVGFLPFTWIWDTTKANDGIHYVTANLRGYEGNFGMATLKVRVSNNETGGGE